MKLTYSISELTPYINWVYYYYAWQVKDGDEQQRLQREALDFLRQQETRYHAYALFVLAEAQGDVTTCWSIFPVRNQLMNLSLSAFRCCASSRAILVSACPISFARCRPASRIEWGCLPPA